MDIGNLLHTALWMSTPIAYAAIGETLAERAGMLNLALEGMMLAGGFAGVVVTRYSGDPWMGVVAAAGAGALIGLIHALLVLWARLDQIVTGIALNLLSLGVTGVLLASIFTGGNRAHVKGLSEVGIPLLEKIPLLGPSFFQQRILTILVPLIGFIAFIAMMRTKLGLDVRAAGQDARSATLEGLRVRALRLWVNAAAGALAGIGGAFLTLGIINGFSDNVIAGRGFVALAVVIIGRWNPLLVVAVAWFFGLAEAFGIELQTSGTDVPFQLFLAIPYVATIVVLLTRVGSAAAPREVGQAWSPEIS